MLRPFCVLRGRWPTRPFPTGLSAPIAFGALPEAHSWGLSLHARCAQAEQVEVPSSLQDARGRPGPVSRRAPGASRFGRAEALAFP